MEGHRHRGRDKCSLRAGFAWQRLLHDKWPLLWGALALALLAWINLLVAGHSWSITWAFSLWGAKVAERLGWSADGLWFWTGGYQEYALNHPVLGKMSLR